MELATGVFEFAARESESPFVESIWRTQSDGSGEFMSTAVSTWELVVARHNGETSIGIRGPETVAMPASFDGESEYFGIQFKLGVYMPPLPTVQRVDSQIELPGGAGRSFWLHGSAWHIPTYDNADIFVAMLTRNGLLAYEPVVHDVLRGRLPDLSLRSVQRRFLHATGLTHGTVAQIERARMASALLEEGVSILDTVELAGYADQPHLTRAIRRFYGKTPAQLLGKKG